MAVASLSSAAPPRICPPFAPFSNFVSCTDGSAPQSRRKGRNLGGKLPLESDLAGRRWRLEIHAARKNATSRKVQQSKGRTVEKPSKLKMVGAPPSESKWSELTTHGVSVVEESALREDQAIGQVMTAQANFMRVFVEVSGRPEGLASSDDRRPPENTGDSDLAAAVNSSCGTNVVGSGPQQRVELLCVVRSLLKKIKRRVLVGDRVLVSGIDWTEGRGMIEEVLDRTSEIMDPPVANVNNLLVVFSIEQPQIEEKVISRFLVEAESTGVDFTLVLNKSDRATPEVVESWQSKLAKWGYEPIVCSATMRIGLAELTANMKDKVSVILGPSGVGKSSIINVLRGQEALSLWYDSGSMTPSAVSLESANGAIAPVIPFLDSPEELEELRVGEVSGVSGRGRHTTRHVKLLRIPGGAGLLADTPGFSQPSLAKVTSTTLPELFPEVRKRLQDSVNGRCGFPDCKHIGEPHCVIGDDWERYAHYLDLSVEIQNREKVQKKVLGTKRENDMRVKKMGAEGAIKGEPRLMLNKHRRESRRQAHQSIEDIFWEEEELQGELAEGAGDI